MPSRAGDLKSYSVGNADSEDPAEQVYEQVLTVFAKAQRLPYKLWKAPDLDFYDWYGRPDRDSTFNAFNSLDMALFRLQETAMSKNGSYITFGRRLTEVLYALESLEEALGGRSNKIAWELWDLAACTTAVANRFKGKRAEFQSRMAPIFARALRCLDALEDEFGKRELQESERIEPWTLCFLPDSDYETALDAVSIWLTRLAQEYTP